MDNWIAAIAKPKKRCKCHVLEKRGDVIPVLYVPGPLRRGQNASAGFFALKTGEEIPSEDIIAWCPFPKRPEDWQERFGV